MGIFPLVSLESNPKKVPSLAPSSPYFPLKHHPIKKELTAGDVQTRQKATLLHWIERHLVVGGVGLVQHTAGVPATAVLPVLPLQAEVITWAG